MLYFNKKVLKYFLQKILSRIEPELQYFERQIIFDAGKMLSDKRVKDCKSAPANVRVEQSTEVLWEEGHVHGRDGTFQPSKGAPECD